MTDEKKPERKAEKLSREYNFELPPRIVKVRFDMESGPTEYSLRRPSLGKRNELMTKLGVFKRDDTVGLTVDEKFWAEVLEVFIDPPLPPENVQELDSFVADKLFGIAQKMLYSSFIDQDTKNA